MAHPEKWVTVGGTWTNAKLTRGSKSFSEPESVERGDSHVGRHNTGDSHVRTHHTMSKKGSGRKKRPLEDRLLKLLANRRKRQDEVNPRQNESNPRQNEGKPRHDEGHSRKSDHENLHSGLKKLTKRLADHPNLAQTKVDLTKVDSLLNRLILSKWSPGMKDTVENLQRELDQKQSQVRRCRGAYAVEVVGLSRNILESNRAAADDGESDSKVHVYGGQVQRWFLRWRDSQTREDFPTWLRDHATSPEKRHLQANGVEYLNKAQAKAHQVEFYNPSAELGTEKWALRWKQSQEAVSRGLYMFVLDNKQRSFFLGRKQKGRFHHSSLVGGAPVACAGFLHINRFCRLSKITFQSGHYKPQGLHAGLLRSWIARHTSTEFAHRLYFELFS